MPLVHEMYPSKYLRGQDFDNYKMLAQIVKVEQQELTARRGAKAERQWVMWVRDVTPEKHRRKFTTVSFTKDGFQVILRKTLAEEIAELTGLPNSDNWPKQYVVLFAIDEKAGGKQVRSVWARKPVAEPKANGGADQAAGSDDTGIIEPGFDSNGESPAGE
jgi:hypothetical protein